MSGFLLCWTSGHVPPRTIYYERRGDWWGTTEDCNQATIFPTRDAAFDQWRALHQWPEDYEKYIANGATRAEPAGTPELRL